MSSPHESRVSASIALEQLEVGYLLFDSDGHVREVSDQFGLLVGLDVIGEIEGGTVHDVAELIGIPQLTGAFDQVVVHHGGRKLMVDFTTPQGRIRHLQITLYWQSYAHETRRQEGVVALVEGVSPQVEQAADVEWQQQVLRLVDDFVFVKDGAGLVRYANAAFHATFNLPHPEQPHADRSLVLDSRQPTYDTATDVLERDGYWTGHLRRIGSDGNVRSLTCTWKRIEEPFGGGHQYLYIERDVTREVGAETRQQEEERLDDMGLMIHGTLHDLNNALGPAVLAVGMVEPDGLGDDAAHLVGVIGERLMAATAISNSIRKYLSGIELTAGSLDLNELADSAFTTVERTFPDAIDTELNAYRGALLVRSIDIYIKRILMNLLVNARDAMDEAGAIKITTERWDDGIGSVEPLHMWNHLAEPSTPCGAITISDSGEGIPEVMISKVFTPYYSTKYDGSGLGLYMVANMVKRLDGALVVRESSLGGTAMTLALPLIRDLL